MDSSSRFEGEQRALVVASEYIHQPCSTVGCTVMIRSLAGKQSPLAPICKWCDGIADSPTHPVHGSPHAMTREEFGIALYEAIYVRAQAQTARKEATRLRHIGKIAKADDLDAVVHSLELRLHAIFDRGNIHPNAIRRILAIGQDMASRDIA